MDLRKVWAALFGVASAVSGFVPDNVEKAAWVAFGLIVVDTLTGIHAAAREKRLSSKQMRTKSFDKAVQYFGLVAVAVGFFALTGQWAWVYLTVYGIVAIEVLSIIENCRRLQKTGVSLGPLNPLLDRMSKYLAVGVSAEIPDPPTETEIVPSGWKPPEAPVPSLPPSPDSARNETTLASSEETP